jgi:hypothetical protein
MNFQNLENRNESQDGMKRIFIKFVGAAGAPREAYIGPGTTAADLLKEFRLDARDYFITKGPYEPYFGVDETLSPSLQDGDMIYVSIHLDVSN